jgi:hypothetical protein
MSEIKSAFKSLTPDQQSLVNDKRTAGSRSPDEWLELLAPVVVYDAKCQQVVKGGGGFFARRFARKHGLPDAFTQFTTLMLPALREDHDPNAPLELNLDFSGFDSGNKLVSTSDPYKQGAYYKIIDSFYDDPWLTAHAQFADGSDVRLTVTDNVRSSKKTKRNPRGKIKTKTKYKVKTKLDAAVVFTGSNYRAGATEQSAPAGGKQKVKPGEKRTAVELSQVLGPDEGQPPVEALMALLGQAYGRVEPTRRKKL